MNMLDVMKYGHRTVMNTLDGLPQADWETEGVCGWWSVKNILAHLASYEEVLIDVLATLTEGDDAATPALARYFAEGRAFNDDEVAARQDMTPDATLAAYCDAADRAMELARGVPVDRRREAGVLPWYGAEYDLEDYIAYQFYGHKREHSAQIAVFRDQTGK
jgi:uncharacterized damage-inducible protein DinB